MIQSVIVLLVMKVNALNVLQDHKGIMEHQEPKNFKGRQGLCFKKAILDCLVKMIGNMRLVQEGKTCTFVH